MWPAWPASRFWRCQARTARDGVRSRCRSRHKTASCASDPCRCFRYRASFEPRSGTGDGHAVDSHGRRIDAVAKFQIVGRRQSGKHGKQVSCHRGLANRIGELSLFDPEAAGAAAVVAGKRVYPHADHLGDVEAFLDLTDHFLRAQGAGREPDIRATGARRAGNPAGGMTGGRKAQLAGAGQIEQPGCQDAIVDERLALRWQSLPVEGTRAEAAPTMGLVDDLNSGSKDSLPKLVLQEGSAACDGGA